MIIDTSALIAILKDEPLAQRIGQIIDQSPSNKISAATFLELALVTDPAGSRSRYLMDELLAEIEVTIEPVTEKQARIARDAYGRFGKASGHRAKLNFGDCFAYALAKDKKESLLFVGDDFSHTDITQALKLK
jgi:ribonuclease VapC